MGQGAAANQHPKNHPSAIDQTEFDLSFDGTDANLYGDEDALFLLSTRRPNLTAPRDARLDRHSAITFVSTQPDVEAHPTRAELANVLDVQRAAARASVDFSPQT